MVSEVELAAALRAAVVLAALAEEARREATVAGSVAVVAVASAAGALAVAEDGASAAEDSAEEQEDLVAVRRAALVAQDWERAAWEDWTEADLAQAASVVRAALVAQEVLAVQG